MRRPSSNATITSDVLRKPVQITADPRVYKGSVFANRRLAYDKARQAERLESKEKKYRVGVIRDQLNTLLPRVPIPRKTPQSSTLFPPAPSKTRSLSTHLPGITSRNESASNVSIDKNRGTRSFATARFMPVSNSKVRNGDIFGKLPSTSKEPPQFPVKVVVNFESNQPSDAMAAGVLSRRRHSRYGISSQTATPPSSSRPVYPIVDSGVQTDDNFDQKFEGLVKELANSAIEMAMINLEAENTILTMRKTAEAAEHELRAVARKQDIESADWRKKMMEKNDELNIWKLQEANAREAQRLAQLTCDEVTRKTLENLRIIEKNSKKSIGLDTRDMVLFEQKMALVTAGS
uniref:TPX2 domain-containing protein n=1 Tax=Caenorhabditis tropicalis TaxID=1561998 RepID=A0A1I7TTK2_9PELO